MANAASFDHTDNIINYDDIVDRIQELEEEREQEADRGYGREYDESEEGKELKALNELMEQMPDVDRNDNVTLINDSYFEQYARELAYDIGAVSGGEKWPLNHIDWKRASRELKQDYIAVDFNGTHFWVWGS